VTAVGKEEAEEQRTARGRQRCGRGRLDGSCRTCPAGQVCHRVVAELQGREWGPKKVQRAPSDDALKRAAAAVH